MDLLAVQRVEIDMSEKLVEQHDRRLPVPVNDGLEHAPLLFRGIGHTVGLCGFQIGYVVTDRVILVIFALRR